MEGIGGLHGWQWIFLIEAVPALLMTLAVLYYLTDRPAQASWLQPNERKWLQDRLDAERATRESHFRMTWVQSMLAPRVIALGFVYMSLNIPQYGLSFFLPQIVKDFGLSNVQAGFVTALPYLVGAVGMVFWGRHSDKTGERKWHVVLSFAAMVVGLGFAAVIPNPVVKMAVLFASRGGGVLLGHSQYFWTLPTAFLSGARGRGRHRRGEFDRQSRRIFRA